MKSPVGVCVAEFHWAGPDEIIETTTFHWASILFDRPDQTKTIIAVWKGITVYLAVLD